MNLKTICRQKGIKKSDLTKEDCFRLGQATVICWYCKMSNKQQKKLRQLVRRKENEIANQVANEIHPALVNSSWDCFFETISQMKFKYRFKLAWKILKGQNIREEEQKKLRK